MSRPDKKSMDVIVIDDDDAPCEPRPRVPDVLAYCYMCRKEAVATGMSTCSQCGRSYHHSCFGLSRPQLGVCAECQRWCASCGKPVTDCVRCPKCALSFHPACEPLMVQFRGQQLCQLCISECINTPHAIEARYENKDILGQRFAAVKFRGVSYLHVTLVPEMYCAGVARTDG